MHDVVVNNKQVPPDLVMRVPRDEQYYVVNGNPPTAARAAALLDQKYPPEELPELYIEDSGTPTFQDYTFLGPEPAPGPTTGGRRPRRPTCPHRTSRGTVGWPNGYVASACRRRPA